MLLYLHGFESSPASPKISQLRDYLSHQTGASELLLAPQQPPRMVANKKFLDDLIATQPITAVMGSSLGGFWTHYVVSQLAAQQRPTRGVLINPAIVPQRLMPEQGEVARIHPHTQEAYQLNQQDREALQQAEAQLSSEVELLVLLQAGDEQLDYREARDYYRQQRMIIEQGGDHSFVDLPRYLPAALEFLNIL